MLKIAMNKNGARRLVMAKNKWIIEPDKLEIEEVAFGAERKPRILVP